MINNNQINDMYGFVADKDEWDARGFARIENRLAQLLNLLKRRLVVDGKHQQKSLAGCQMLVPERRILLLRVLLPSDCITCPAVSIMLRMMGVPSTDMFLR